MLREGGKVPLDTMKTLSEDHYYHGFCHHIEFRAAGCLSYGLTAVCLGECDVGCVCNLCVAWYSGSVCVLYVWGACMYGVVGCLCVLCVWCVLCMYVV